MPQPVGRRLVRDACTNRLIPQPSLPNPQNPPLSIARVGLDRGSIGQTFTLNRVSQTGSREIDIGLQNREYVLDNVLARAGI
jgi:hypothetical protein